MYRKIREKKAFTLVEVMIVCCVMAIVCAGWLSMMTSFAKMLGKSNVKLNEMVCKHNQALITFAIQNIDNNSSNPYITSEDFQNLLDNFIGNWPVEDYLQNPTKGGFNNWSDTYAEWLVEMLENKKDNDSPSLDDLETIQDLVDWGYLSVIPHCPKAGEYSLDLETYTAACSHEGHGNLLLEEE